MAANRVLGSVWRACQIPPRPAASKNDPATQAVRFGGPPGASVTASEDGLFLHQKGPCVQVLVSRLLMSQWVLTVAAPRLSAPTDAELHVEAMNLIWEALQTSGLLTKSLLCWCFQLKHT